MSARQTTYELMHRFSTRGIDLSFDASVIRRARRNTIKIGINAALLLDLARAINEQTGKWDENVTLYLSAEDTANSAVFVRAGKGSKAYGVIMPVRM